MSHPAIDSTTRRTLFSLGGFIVSAATGFVTAVVVARVLGPRESGAFFIAVAVATVLMYVTVFGADSGLLRSIARDRALGRADALATDVSVGLLPVAIAGVVVAAILFAAADPLGALLFGDIAGTGPNLVRTCALALPAMSLAFAILHGATRGFDTIGPLVWCWQVGLSGLRLAILPVTAIALGSLTWTFAGWALAVLPVVVVASWILRRQVRIVEADAGIARADRVTQPGATGRFWRFAAPRGAASVFEIGIVWIDVILLGALRSLAEAGVYGALSRFITTGALALQAGRIAISSELVAAFTRNDLRTVERLYATSTALVTLMAWPVYLSLAVFSEDVLAVFGPGFSDGATALSIIALASLLTTAAGNVSVVLLMAGKSSWTAANTAASLITNVALNALLIPPLGMEGSAIAWAATIAVGTALALFQVRRSLGIRGHGRPFVMAAALPVAMFGAGGFLVDASMSGRPVGLATSFTGLVLVYAAAVAAFRRNLMPGAA